MKAAEVYDHDGVEGFIAAEEAGVEIYTIPEEEMGVWEEPVLPLYEAWVEDMEADGYDGQGILDDAIRLRDEGQSKVLDRTISSFETVVLQINKFAAIIAGVILLAMMTLTFLDVVGRFFWQPITGAHELTYMALALIVFLSLGFTQVKKGHISIDFLVERFPRRFQAWLSLITYGVMLVILALMTWKTFTYSVQISSTVTGDLGLPVSAFIITGGIGLAIFVLTIVLDFLKSVREVVGQDES